MSNKNAVINLKTDPELKKRAVRAADKLGISVSALLNNELRRFATEQSVSFELPERPNAATRKLMESSKARIAEGDYHTFDSNREALKFLADELE